MTKTIPPSVSHNLSRKWGGRGTLISNSSQKEGRLFEGGAYSRGALIQGFTVYWYINVNNNNNNNNNNEFAVAFP